MQQWFQLEARTVDGLRLLMNNICKKHGQDPITDEGLIWFVCIQQALLLAESGTKSIAHVLGSGTQPINALTDVQDYIDSLFWDDSAHESEQAEQEGYLVESVYQHLGVDLRLN